MYSRLAISHSDDEDETHRIPDPSPGGVSPAEDANNQAHVGHHQRAASTPEPSGRKDADDIFGLFDNNDAGEGPKPSAASFSSAQHQENCQTSSTSPESDSPAPPVRMTREQQAELPDHDGAQLDRRELLLYALPLYHDSENPLDGLCFLPVSNFLEEKDYSGMTGGIKRRMDELQDKVDTKWQELKTAEPGTFSNKVYKVGHNVANDLTPEQRLTQNIPENVSKVIVFHPRQVPPDAILEKLTAVSSGQSKWTTAKAAMATLMLPVALGIDVLIIPGPSILTWYTSYQIYKNASSAVGSQRLNKYLNNRDECNVRVNYAGDARLDPYWDEVQHAHDGALDEESCEQLVNDIGQPELLEPVLELRKRWLQENMPTTRASFTGGGQEYQALRNGEACHY